MRFNSGSLSSVVLVLVFVALLCAPVVRMVLGPAESVAGTENRTLAKPPQWSWSVEALEQFPKDLESYFNDRFGFRNQLIRARHLLHLKVFGESSTDKVLIGKEGWFYISETVQQKLTDYAPFYDKRFAEIKDREAFLAGCGIPYVFVLTADKERIYPEYLKPVDLQRLSPSPGQRFFREMKQRGQLPMLNMEDHLLAYRAEHPEDTEPLYYKTDTHWNFRGSLVCWKVLAQKLVQAKPGFMPETFEDLHWDKTRRTEGDLARMLGFPNDFDEDSYQNSFYYPWGFDKQPVMLTSLAHTQVEPSREPIVWNRPGGTGKALVIHDSYCTALKQYVAENFGATVFVWQYLDNQTFRALVEEVQPDVVIEEHVARKHDLSVMFGELK